MFALLIQCAWSLPLSYYVSTNPDPKASSFLGEGQYSTLVYREQEPLQSEPIIPFWASALRFDRDVMIALEDDGDWGMLEIAMIKDAEDKEVWFALDSKKNGQQFIGLPDHPQAEHLASLFPLTRYRAAPQVLREGNELAIQYRRIDGADISFRIPFRDKMRPPAKRNGHAMNHSQGDMLALLDISSLDLQPVRWESGQRRRAQKVAWKSISGVMQQTVVAMKRASWQQKEREIDGVEMTSQIVDGRYCLQNDVQSYCFDQIEHERQLRYIELFQPLRGDSIAKISLNPSLPDLRFLPLEKRCSKMMVSIGTRAGYQTGKICVSPTENGVQVLIESLQPSWAKERPLLTELLMDNNRVQGNSTIMSVGGHQESVAVYPVGERKERSVVLDSVSKSVKQPVKALSFWIGADKLQSKTLSGVPIHEIDTAWFPMNVDWDDNSTLKGAHRIKVRNPDP
ncbi:MAG: hypothetical protein VX278_20605, partial [Myxococcota bacterium]|nr:hypothetical protein [Myxococcota bacterium]